MHNHHRSRGTITVTIVFAMPAKIILVTGGNHGIGFGVVQAIAQQSTEQHTIIIASRKKGDAEEAIAEAQKWGSDIRFHPLALDVTSDDSISSAVQEVEQVFGRLDGKPFLPLPASRQGA